VTGRATPAVIKVRAQDVSRWRVSYLGSREARGCQEHNGDCNGKIALHWVVPPSAIPVVRLDRDGDLTGVVLSSVFRLIMCTTDAVAAEPGPILASVRNLLLKNGLEISLNERLSSGQECATAWWAFWHSAVGEMPQSNLMSCVPYSDMTTITLKKSELLPSRRFETS
jgi:hypothetical protein